MRWCYRVPSSLSRYAPICATACELVNAGPLCRPSDNCWLVFMDLLPAFPGVPEASGFIDGAVLFFNTLLPARLPRPLLKLVDGPGQSRAICIPLCAQPTSSELRLKYPANCSNACGCWRGRGNRVGNFFSRILCVLSGVADCFEYGNSGSCGAPVFKEPFTVWLRNRTGGS